MGIIKAALCQNRITNDKEETVGAALDMVRAAAGNGARLVVLPEMFTTPYTNRSMRENREPGDGPTAAALSKLANDEGIYIVGGSFPEEENDKLYNTCLIYGPDGSLIGKHRKAHLFDVDIPGKVTFKESNTFEKGNAVTEADTAFGRMGVGICFDLRFPEYFRRLALDGCTIIAVPASFAVATGEAHWIMSIRMRAMDNQCYVLGCSPAPNPELPYQAYGHTAVADPFGKLIGELDVEPGILYADIDTDYIAQVRNEFPLLKARRPELY